MSSLPAYRQQFLETCLSANALKFGTFTLKSGRQSPYFFNAGLFDRGDLIAAIANAYAHTLATHTPRLDFDVLFGPAYKGIPLATATVYKLAESDASRFGHVRYSFNRKETKDHGEGGNLVGAPLQGKKVVIVDDVITAGTAIREAIEIIKREGGELVAIVVAVDRMEKLPKFDADGKQIRGEEDDGEPRPSAIGEVRKQYGIPVFAILTLDDIMQFLKGVGSPDDIRRMEEYRSKYKASD